MMKFPILFLFLPIHVCAQEKDTFKLSIDFNSRLKYLADSAMINWFGEVGFKKNFMMSCLQNPCEVGYLYANIMESDKPCATKPQNACKEAIITYNHLKKGVNLTLKMMVSLKENGEFIYLQQYNFGNNKFTLQQQNLLSIDEIQKKIKAQFPNDEIKLISYPNALTYSNSRIKEPDAVKESFKLKKDPGYRLIKESDFGEKWKSGFIYTACSTNLSQLQKMYYFDASTGNLLWITEVYKVTN